MTNVIYAKMTPITVMYHVKRSIETKVRGLYHTEPANNDESLKLR